MDPAPVKDSAMTFDIVVGVTLTALALGAVAFLTWWSRRIIERIHSRSPSSLREIKADTLHPADK